MHLNKGFYLAMLAASFWAVSIVLSRYMLRNGENAYNLLFWITILAIPFWLYRLFSIDTVYELKGILRKNYGLLLSMGVISTFGVNIAEAFALKYSHAINYAFLIRSSVLFTILFAYLFLGERLTKRKLFLVGIILLGAYLLTTQGQILQFSLGDIFTLIQAMLIALGNNVFGKLATNRMNPRVSAAASFLVGIVPVIVLGIYHHAITWPLLPWVILLMTITNILIVICRFQAYAHVSASYMSMLFSLTPVFVSVLAVLFLGETITVVQIVGGLLIISAGLAVHRVSTN